MKILVLLLTITLLASCTNKDEKIENTEIWDTKVIEETVNDIEKSMNSLDDLIKDESKVQLINYKYSNPAQEVNLNIEYNLDAENKISMISITSDNWDKLEWFNTAAQEVLIGKTLKQASEVDLISGASLTTEAFKEAIKSQL